METAINAARRKPVRAWAARYDGANASTLIAMISADRVRATFGHVSGPGRGMTPALKLEGLHCHASVTVGDWLLVDPQKVFWSMTDEEFHEEFEPEPPVEGARDICWCGQEIESGENHSMCHPGMD